MNETAASRLLAWVLVGAGVLLVYSAVRKRSPLNVLQGVAEESPALTSSNVGPIGFTSPSSGSEASAGGRIAQLVARQTPPDLVSIKPHGRLDREAAASKARIDAKVGYAVDNVGNYRSVATQASNYAANPNRFARPGKSLHEVGLAIDVHAKHRDRPEVIAAFQSEGWIRYDPVGEPWHWSYRTRG